MMSKNGCQNAWNVQFGGGFKIQGSKTWQELTKVIVDRLIFVDKYIFARIKHMTFEQKKEKCKFQYWTHDLLKILIYYSKVCEKSEAYDDIKPKKPQSKTLFTNMEQFRKLGKDIESEKRVYLDCASLHLSWTGNSPIEKFNIQYSPWDE